jgi:SNF2 family DNA or RNA helicase
LRVKLALRPYQELMLEHAFARQRCALWAGMGVGKTFTSLAYIQALQTVEVDGPALVLAPKRVAVDTWPSEAKKWGFGEVTPIVGDAAARVRALKRDTPVHAINYENIPWLVEHLGKSVSRYRICVGDESSKLKGFRLRHGGKRTRILDQFAHSIPWFLELTGTPAANGLKDLWGQMWFIDRGQRLGRTYTAFMERWFRTGYDGYSVEPLPHAFDEITARCKDVCLTIKSEDWFDLEELITTNVMVKLPASARKLYNELEKEMFAQLKGRDITAVNAAAKSGKLLQVANGAVYLDPLGEERGRLEWKEVHDAKIQALDSIVSEQAGAPLLVAYHFQSDLARLRAAFPRARTLDSSAGEVDRWNRGETELLLVHPASAGHGLNLQHGGNAIAFFGNWWNLEERLQIIERIGPTRQAQSGYDRPVFIHNIIARDTVDELVIERIETKRETQDILLDAMKRKRA